jgi:two-component system chemotaxis sensor kinase CheA
MGYNTMKRLTHAQEGILDGIRQTKDAVASQEMISVLLECLDVLKEMTQRIEEDRPHDIDIEPLIKRLNQSTGGPEKDKTQRAGYDSPEKPLKPLTPSGAGLKLSSIMKVEGRVFDELLNLTGELLTVFSGLRAMAAQSRSIELKEEVYSLGKTIEALRTNILTSRMLPFQDLTQNLPRIVRDISRKNGKRIELKIEGSEISLDRSILEKMGDPLVHIIRNAVDHGIEDVDERKKAGKPDVGTIAVKVSGRKERVVIEVEDDRQERTGRNRGRRRRKGDRLRKTPAKGPIHRDA